MAATSTGQRNTFVMLEKGRIEAWYGVKSNFLLRWRIRAIDINPKLFIGETLTFDDLWLAGGKKLSAVIAENLRINTSKTIDEGHRKKLLSKYFIEK